MSQIDKDNEFIGTGWSTDQEKVLESIRSNAAVMSKHHKKNYLALKGQLKYYRIPVIIISGFNSVAAVGLQPYLEQGLISASNCLLALICGIIGSIELFLGLQASMESELIASRNFYLLSIDIYKTLMLDRSRRISIGKDFLEEKYGEYTKLFGVAQLLRGKISDQLAHPCIPVGDFDYSSVSSSPIDIGLPDNDDIEIGVLRPHAIDPQKVLEEARQDILSQLKFDPNQVLEEAKRDVLSQMKFDPNQVLEEAKRDVITRSKFAPSKLTSVGLETITE